MQAIAPNFFACDHDQTVIEILQKLNKYDLLMQKAKEKAGTMGGQGERFFLKCYASNGNYYLFTLFAGFANPADNGFSMYQVTDYPNNRDLVELIEDVITESSAGPSHLLYIDDPLMRN